MKTLDFNVVGMHCMGCANSIGRVLERKTGIESAQVIVEEGLAKVSFDEEVVTVDDIIAAITKLGYEATVR